MGGKSRRGFGGIMGDCLGVERGREMRLGRGGRRGGGNGKEGEESRFQLRAIRSMALIFFGIFFFALRFWRMGIFGFE